MESLHIKIFSLDSRFVFYIGTSLAHEPKSCNSHKSQSELPFLHTPEKSMTVNRHVCYLRNL